VKKLIIFGLSNIAECAYEYFTHDSNYEVCAFSVDANYIDDTKKELFGLPIVALEDIVNLYPPQQHDIFVAVGSQKLNRLRTEKAKEVQNLGYGLASYISSRTFIWPNVEIGEHAFIQEDNTIQPFVKIGSNVVLWAGNHIGHASVIEDNCFITSHVVISGHCYIGKNSFIGVNAALADTVKVGSDNFIGMGVNIVRNTKDDQVYKPAKSELSNIGAQKFMRVHK
jgi:sugar O-acyltransferase (sialic acid O-acetyltransferase NeuD family)